MTHRFTLSLTAALLLATAPCAVAAQEVVQALPGTTDADKLGDVMRQLATSPQNVDALLRAGELSIVVGDLSGAAALFARAEKIDPRNGRIKAGMATILVRSERPGEALRYYAQAEGLGLEPRRFAADRALAYDLIGQQDRAQRDYRVALRDAPDDETVRRYALSLGISGKQELALKQLAPLLQKTDRGAWRARAFILAMTGDVPAAERIATTMMPTGMAQGLLPFFARLPSLPASDRAFAVHFGEVHATPERIADARMAPPLPMLGPDASAPVMMAAVQPVAAPEVKSQKSQKNDRRARSRVETAAAAPVATRPVVQPAPVAMAQVRAAPPVTQPYRAPVTLAQATPPVVLPAVAPTRTAAPSTTGQLPAATVTQMAAMPAPAGAPATRASSIVVQPTPIPAAPTVAAPMSSLATARPLPSPGFPNGAVASVPVPASTPAAEVVASVPAVVTPASTVAATPVTIAPAPVVVATTATPVAETTPPMSGRAGDDSILARIVAGLSIPASELDVAPAVARPTPRATPAVAPIADDGARVLAEAQAKAQRDAAAKAVLAKKLAAEKKLADKKAVADKKALAEKKAAAAEKAIADKEAAEEKRIARLNPERIWVQVAGGATEGDLPKAWKAVKAKAPTAFAARSGWTTPLRATNRVLTGPFKTDAEARAFVNQLAKGGVSAFTFTSDAGQPVTRLPAK
jgi:Flp pilus assembly protein TadD